MLVAALQSIHAAEITLQRTLTEDYPILTGSQHPERRISNSDWFTNSSVVVVCEKKLEQLGHQILGVVKMVPLTTIIKLFTNQSELDILPAG